MNKRHTLLLALVLAVTTSGCLAPAAAPSPAPAATATTLPTAVPATATAVPSATAAATATPAPTGTPTATPAPTRPPIGEVIEWEQRGALNFFWEQANQDPASPGCGLIRDRYPGSPGIASIASVGFGLTAYVIGVENGWLGRDEAERQTACALATLQGLERTEGFYYHFLDMQTGKRAWNSEVSSIDTAILLMGVLTAGEYFGGDLEAQAQAIYAGVNWPWFLDRDRQMFYMAYRPEEGFGGYWDFYAEQLMLYVLAAGSPTHPVDSTPYYTFTRHYGKYGEGEAFIHSWFGSIFTYQFSHAWIDFRPYTDRKDVNWFDNSVAASRAHYDFAVDQDEKYETLGPLAWGLTASDGPEGYNGLYGAPPSGFDNRQHKVDDTVAPAGAIGSILFLPEQAQAAMQNYYTLERLHGPYGFQDAYNLSRNWFASDVIGIDKGVSLLMLANAEAGTVYAVTGEIETLAQGLSRLELSRAP